MLAPVLLLLNQQAWSPDPAAQQRRYAPCAAAVVVYLAASCLWQLGQQLSLALDPLRPDEARIPWATLNSILRDFVALVFVLPLHYLFLQVSIDLPCEIRHAMAQSSNKAFI